MNLAIDVLSDIAGSYTDGIIDAHLSNADLYLFVYSITSLLSFYYASDYPQKVYRMTEKENLSMMIVGNHRNEHSSRIVSEEERCKIAKENGCESCEVCEDDMSSLELAFSNLVRRKWALEREDQQKWMQGAQETKTQMIRKQPGFSMKQLLRRSKRSDQPSTSEPPLDTSLEVIKETGWI